MADDEIKKTVNSNLAAHRSLAAEVLAIRQLLIEAGVFTEKQLIDRITQIKQAFDQMEAMERDGKLTDDVWDELQGDKP